MKKYLFCVVCCIAVLLSLSVGASAASTVTSGNCGTNVTWELDSDGLLSISGSGTMKDYTQISGRQAPWYSKASAVKKVVVSSGVTSIGDFAFNKCTNLTYLSIPSSVTSIGDYAFQDCTSLTSVQISGYVSSIGNSPFRGCTRLMEISVSSSNSDYTSLGGVLFDKNFTRLIQFPAGRTGAYNVPYGIRTIGLSAFQGCGLTSVTLPETVTDIEMNAFYGSTAMTQVTLSPKLQTLKEWAFYQCDLREIVVPASLEIVEDATFEYCANLSNMALLNPDVLVMAYAFSDTATKNKTVYFAGTEAYYDELRPGSGLCIPSSYYNNQVFFSPTTGTCGDDLAWYYFADGTLYLDGVGDMYDYTAGTSPWCNVSVKEVILPNGLTSIGAYAFAGQDFDTISLPASVVSIGRGAFEDCGSLAQVVFDGPKELWNTVSTNGAVSDSLVVCDCADGHTFSYGVCTQCGNHGGQCGADLQWVIVNNTLVISGSGDMYGYSNGTAPWNALCQKIKYLMLGENITSIGTSAFWGMEAITEVVIPDAVTSIGKLAFCRCSALQEIELPDNLTTIGDYAFDECTELKKLSLPDSVTTIGARAFYGCTKLAEIRWSGKLTTICEYAFWGCSSLKSLTLPNTVRTIGEMAFSGCKNVASISLSTQLSSLGDYAFSYCSQLTAITIPDGITQLPNYLFYECTKLASVAFSDNVASIGDSCFSGCSSLTSVPWPSALKTLGRYSFDGCKKLTDVVIPEGVTVIPYGCFDDCTSMLEIVLPADLTTIEDYAFYYSDTPAYMKYVFFQGTKEQWKSVSIGSYNYRLTVGSRMHYETSGHIEGVNPAVSPTCISSGLSEGKSCPFCNLVFVAQQTVPATGHIAVTHEGKQPTCGASGWKAYVTCENCDYSTYEKLEATGEHTTDVYGKCIHCQNAEVPVGYDCTTATIVLHELPEHTEKVFIAIYNEQGQLLDIVIGTVGVKIHLPSVKDAYKICVFYLGSNWNPVSDSYPLFCNLRYAYTL